MKKCKHKWELGKCSIVYCKKCFKSATKEDFKRDKLKVVGFGNTEQIIFVER